MKVEVSGANAPSDADVLAGFAQWCRQQWPERDHLRVRGPGRPGFGNGWSSETLFFSLSWWDSESADVVVRISPPGPTIFPEYDLKKQTAIQQGLARAGIPVAPTLAFEADTHWIGRPFMVMERADGQIPREHPPYFREGWIYESTPTDQRVILHSFLGLLARIHQVDWQANGLAVASRPSGIGLDAELMWWESYLDWLREDTEPEDMERLTEVINWCRDHLPSDEPAPSLIWGDPRIGNLVYQGTAAAAALDWEMATIGPAELDFAFFWVCRNRALHRAGTQPPELPGFLDEAATLATYEGFLGRPLRHLDWHEIFADLRVGASFAGLKRVLRITGREPSALGTPVPDTLLAMVRQRS